MLRWQRFRSLSNQCPQVQVFFQQVGTARESLLKAQEYLSRAHCMLWTVSGNGGFAWMSKHWGFVLCPQFSSPMKLIPVMQLNSCFFTRGFSVGFYNEHHQFLPQEQTLGLLGLAVTQSQQCWCISLHSTG